MRLHLSATHLARSLFCAITLISATCAMHAPVLAQTEGATSARVIVKFKAEAGDATSAAANSPVPSAQVEGMSRRLGMRLRAGVGIAERTQLVTADGISSAQLAAQLSQDRAVDYAVPDQLRRAAVAPNDPRYTSVAAPGPAVGQWYLRAPSGAVQSAINIEGAWAAVAGVTSGPVVVAVIDTGVRFDHPDLKRVADGGNLLDGYDFITNNFISNDPNPGRDSDASDPGDWVTAADVASAANTIGCTAAEIANSSWHGTQTIGLLGALTNNARGMAGVTGPNRTLRVLPVRVLGRCGGFDSDIIAAMRWSAGLSVPGVPANPNPARVLNLSLGGSGACSAAYADAVREINLGGGVIVAAAGNTTGHAVNSPANCVGVIGVAGLRHVGSKVGFSDLGPEIALSAPGGNCVNLAGECLYPLLTTSNSGTTAAVVGNELYTDGANATFGTSFSSPLVAGTVGLMLAVRPAFNTDQVRSALRATSRPFPTSGDTADVPRCNAPQRNSAGEFIDQLECYCTTSTCGAGMLDASAAVLRARDEAAAPAPVPPKKKSGGGALSLVWLLALGVAVGAVARSRRNA